MKSLIYPILSTALFASIAPTLRADAPETLTYEFVPNFITPPAGLETIGSGHGEIQVDSAGNIYVSVEATTGGMQVYSPDGKFLKHLPLPKSLHGFSIKKHADGEFIYAAVLDEQRVIKASLDGKIVMEIPTSAFPQEIASRISFLDNTGTQHSGHSPVVKDDSLTYTTKDGKSVTVKKSDIAKKATITLADGKRKEGVNLVQNETSVTITINGQPETIEKSAISQKDGKLAIREVSSESRSTLKLTSADSSLNGDIYVVDGYGSDWIFIFNDKGVFKSKFGGSEDLNFSGGEKPTKLSNCHKVHVDTRYFPELLFLCDRGNKRILSAALDGEWVDVVADKLRNPSSASFYKDYVCIAEIAGRVSVFDKRGTLVATLGTNDTPGQTNTPQVKPADWRDNIVTSPHGITFDANGNILMTEWNKFGRVLRWNKK